MRKGFIFFLFVIFRLRKEDLYLWILLGGERRHGGAKQDELLDKTRERGRAKKLTKAVLKKLLADAYYNSVEDDIRKVDEIVGQSILDIFDDHPVFASSRFAHLRTLARNREFEIMYYGKVR